MAALVHQVTYISGHLLYELTGEIAPGNKRTCDTIQTTTELSLARFSLDARSQVGGLCEEKLEDQQV